MTKGKKIASAVAVVIVVLIAGVFALAATKPDEYRYARSMTVDVPPQIVHDQVNNLHTFNQWSPWAKVDPDAKITYEGPEVGPGAKMSWDGNAKVGSGSMTITGDTTNNVTYQLNFLKPMQGTANAEIAIEGLEVRQSKVTWSMTGHSTYLQKVISVAMNCEHMMNKQFDEGLANLKALAEKNK
jgi:hypothetical protein